MHHALHEELAAALVLRSRGEKLANPSLWNVISSMVGHGCAIRGLSACLIIGAAAQTNPFFGVMMFFKRALGKAHG